MPVIITNPSAGERSPVDKFHVVEGGTGGKTLADGLHNLGGIDRVKKGVSSGPVPLDAGRMIPANYLADFNPTALGINGPLVVLCGTKTAYQLTNYDSYGSYVGEATVGSVYIDGNHAFYTAPEQAGPCGFSVNGRIVALTAIEGQVTTPTIISPEEGAVIPGKVLTIQGSVFECVDDGPLIEAFVSADCEISRNAEFTDIIVAIYGNPNATFVFVNPITVDGPFIRIRYHSTTRTSAWSPTRHLVPAPSYVVQPAITAPIQYSTVGIPDTADVYKDSVLVNVTNTPFAVENYIDTYASSDYDVSTMPDFSNIVAGTSNNPDSDTAWQAAGLDYGTMYYLRMKHRGLSKESTWSDAVQFFTIPDPRYIVKPVVLSGVPDPTKSTLTIDFTGSDFQAMNYGPTAGLSHWEIATDPGFTNLVFGGNYNGIIGSGAQLNYNSVYYVRVYYFDNYKRSEWSDVLMFTTPADDRTVVKPMITAPVNNASVASLTPTAEASAIQTTSGLVTYNEPHVSSDWELSTTPDFSTLTNSLYNSTTNKTSWPLGTLTYGLRYYLRTRQRTTTKTSNWSDPTIFYTAAVTTAMATITGAGGGGGGGGARDPGPDTYGNGGGGGGSGYLFTKNDVILLTGEIVPVVVGAGGAGGLGGAAQGHNGSPGAAGARSSLAAYFAAGGEGGGAGTAGTNRTYTGAGGAGLVSGAVGGMSGDNNSTAGIGGAGGVSAYGGNGAAGGNGGYANVPAAPTGSSGVVILEYSGTMPTLTTTGATYALVNGRHRYTWSVAGSYTYMLNDTSIRKPTLSISGGTVNTPFRPTLNGDVFTPVNYTDTHASSSWQIATDANFANVVASSTNDTTNKTSWTPNVGLAAATTYYGRVRYNGSQRSSDWSAGVQFTTQPPPLPAPVISSVSIDMPSSIGIDMYSISDGGVDRNAAWYIDLSFVIDGATVRTISNIPASWTGYTNGNVSDSLGSYAITITVNPFITYSVLLRADISLQYGNSSNPNVFLGATSVTMSMRLKTSTGSVSPWTVPINCNIVYPDVPVAGG